MFISVVICTWNRASSLERTLESITRMNVPDGLVWELIVVDNGSTDRTRDVINGFKSRLPIRAIREATPGLSNARNAGIRNVHGNYIVWTDDDVIVDRDWLSAYASAFLRWPDAAVFGGRIVPVFEGSSPPKWFVDNLDILTGVVASRDFGNCALPLSVPEQRIPFGANYAVRTAEQRANLYDANLGLTFGRSRRNDEVQVITAILGAGAHGYYVPDSKVEHMITESRQTKSYVFNYFRGYGDTLAYIQYSRNGENGSRVFGLPRWLWRKLVWTWAESFLACVFKPQRQWLLLFIDYAIVRGTVDYFRTVGPNVEASVK